jgi:hypothetical protein
MRSLILILSTAALGSCAVGPPSPQAAMRDQQAALQEQQALATQLAGRVAGQPTSCLPTHRANNQMNISDNTILFDFGNTIYRNDPPGGCAGLGSGHYALVTTTIGSSLCRGDIAQVKDIQSGVVRGTCSLGDFIPYTRVRS